MTQFTRLILIQILMLTFTTSPAFAKVKSSKKAKKAIVVKKHVVAKNKTPAKKMTEKERKALAKRQVEHARMIAGVPAKKPSLAPPEFKANDEVTIRDYGFETTPPTNEDTARVTATITTEDLILPDTSLEPYTGGG